MKESQILLLTRSCCFYTSCG